MIQQHPQQSHQVSLKPYLDLLGQVESIRREGILQQAVGLTFEASGLSLQLGDLCAVDIRNSHTPILAEAVGFRDGKVILMPFGDTRGVEPGCKIRKYPAANALPSGTGLLGRVIDALGHPIDNAGPLQNVRFHTTDFARPNDRPLDRTPVHKPIATGVRAIDSLLTCGEGQRLGVFAGSGVGKSTLLGMIARGAQADVIVVGLIGERGREVREFIEDSLGEGLQKSVVVVSTSDQPALLRLKAAWTATSIAEQFRNQGLHVLLLIDSVTRFAMAQREIGLAIGEPPALRGYPPSVFATLPRLLERTGTTDKGAITAFYTVLVEGGDFDEPVTDTARSVLDGHIVLSRELADANHFPSIDVLQSVSRTMNNVVSAEHRSDASEVRDLLAIYRQYRDLVTIGAYVPGTNPKLDRAIRLMPAIEAFLKQFPSELSNYDETISLLHLLCQPGSEVAA